MDKSRQSYTPQTDTLEECVSKVCRVIRNHLKSDESFTTVAKRTGYLEWRSEVAPELIEAELRRSPDLFNVWSLWSEDKRWSPAWYLSATKNDQWIVGYFHSDKSKRTERRYNEKFLACAHFIKEEMEEWANQSSLLKKVF